MIKIAIASGKGGTGKTFVATNIFHTLVKNLIDSVLVDCDAEAPNAVAFFETKQTEAIEVTQLVPVINTSACTFCGKCHEYCNYNAIFILPPMKIINVIEDLCHGCGACSVASCLHDMQRTVEIVQKFILPAFVIINKYDLNSVKSDQIEDWCKQNRITIAGLLPFDKQMVEAMIMGKSITEFNPDNEISKKIKITWNKIINQKK
jgi:MinD superfamily P-loop ATPase